MANQMPTTNITEIRCQDIQWTVSKYVVVAIGTRINILKIFNANSIAKAVMIALVLVSSFMSAVDISSSNSR